MTNLESILKSRDITLPTKVHLVKAMVFPVVMYGCESWTIEKAEHRGIDTFELWCWRRLLSIILHFHTVHAALKARILKWFAIPFFSGPHSVRPLHQDPPILGGPRTWRGLGSLS